MATKKEEDQAQFLSWMLFFGYLFYTIAKQKKKTEAAEKWTPLGKFDEGL